MFIPKDELLSLPLSDKPHNASCVVLGVTVLASPSHPIKIRLSLIFKMHD